MKNLITIFVLFAVLFSTSCKKTRIENSIENTTWKLKTITQKDLDKTAEILDTKTVLTTIAFENKNGRVIFSESTRPIVDELEEGNWTIEKIVPTIGKNYYLIKNALPFSQKRVNVFNLGEYGSQVRLIKGKIIQEIEDYTITYEKVN